MRSRKTRSICAASEKLSRCYRCDEATAPVVLKNLLRQQHRSESGVEGPSRTGIKIDNCEGFDAFASRSLTLAPRVL